MLRGFVEAVGLAAERLDLAFFRSGERAERVDGGDVGWYKSCSASKPRRQFELLCLLGYIPRAAGYKDQHSNGCCLQAYGAVLVIGSLPQDASREFLSKSFFGCPIAFARLLLFIAVALSWRSSTLQGKQLLWIPYSSCDPLYLSTSGIEIDSMHLPKRPD